MGFFSGMGIWEIPIGREIPKTQEILESWEFPRNSHMGKSLGISKWGIPGREKFEAI